VPIKIDGYLTESKLAAAIQQFEGVEWIGTQYMLRESRFRWDVAFQQNGSQVLVEFDGDAHYRDSLKIKVDQTKDSLALKQGCKVVRVPYWVQLNRSTAQHYFGISAEIIQNFQHGFITTKLFPASWCAVGIERFKCELQKLPEEVKEAVINSLRDRIQDHGIEYVLPTSLRNLVCP
jgi:very-short-patch-repair endonuclease